jgi:hypothetical protein
VTTPADENRLTAAAAVLMVLVLLWSGALAAGFTWAAVAGGDRMSAGRTVIFSVIAGFLVLLWVRTAYELGRRLLLSRGARTAGR